MTRHRVLIVEDERDNLHLFDQLLTMHGCEVLTARDGREAITMAQREVPDLILMDLSLPVLDGWEAMRAIKDIPGLAHIPVVALTAHAMMNERERAMEAGCDGYITKPIEVVSFFEQVCAYLPNPSAASGTGDE